ncbi:Aste57867_878 [Aphanomyces stellatus]|uniref:Aste57867_878 protein n=1 Tax=Aphanomyces stellatus TaxID=120398 RepID=A0A485K908_9STRA|nr:hypothetical protein As57867_000877 [Aphanomyces stellatus]VFT78102.1 Aste57867_878 [Aphanomyces stellatus]
MAKKSGRGKSWCPTAVDLLLDIAGEVLPLGKNGWEKVDGRFNRLGAPQLLPVRDGEALKRKFLLLKNHAKPTGDPDCPEEVQRAKRIQRDIDMSVSVLSLKEIDEDDYTNDGLLHAVRLYTPNADDGRQWRPSGRRADGFASVRAASSERHNEAWA